VRALAIAAGIPQPTLARYLKGTSETMELANWMALAKELGVTVSELLGEVEISSRGEVQELMNTLILLDESHRSALLAAAKAMANSTKKHPPK
jgi:transcriptional regulator with XRE-family HTH domain